MENIQLPLFEKILFQYSIKEKYLAEQIKEIKENYEKFKEIFHNPIIQNNLILAKEEQYQSGFIDDLFCKCLGYTLYPHLNYNIKTEYKNENDARKSDAAIIVEDNPIAVIELKNHKIVNLKKVEDQAFSCKNNSRNVRYVLTSNFQYFRFYIENTIDFIEFDLFNLTEEEFGLLYLCIAYKNLSNDLAKQMKQESIEREERITKKLYKDYNTFKNDLFNNILKHNLEKYNNKLLLFEKTQKLLNRFLFICFAQYRNFIKANTIQNEIIGGYKEIQKNKFSTKISLYDCIKQYFNYLNAGYTNEIFAYNGGLFANDEILDDIIITDDILLYHLEKIAKYNFETDIDVNILGHIFENSFSDIEEIKSEIEGEKIPSKRKKDGVYYTPNTITKYIIRNTIGKLCENKKQELNLNIEDYYEHKTYHLKEKIILNDKLDSYRYWLKEITICDPAVGSGAFLNVALDFLIKEHKQIDYLKEKLKLNKKNEIVFTEDSGNYILENNLYGVDINEESIDITKLSLWLKTLRKNQKLSSINNNIRCGNSLINEDLFENDKPIYKKAFIWEKEFPHIFEKGGFDIIIGNPPYGAKYPEIYKEFFKQNYKCTQTIKGLQKGNYDTYVLFLEKAHNLVKDGGVVNMIVPMSIVSSDSSTALHNLLFNTCSFIELSNYLHRPTQIFSDAGTAVSIIKYKKDNKPIRSILATKPQRKKIETDLENIIEELEFIEVNDLRLFGRIPKISKEIERSILKKVFDCDCNISTLKQEKGKPIYYRMSGGEYWKLITNYSTGSISEKEIYFDEKIANSIGAILSSSLYYYFNQVVNANGFNTNQINKFGVPFLKNSIIIELEKLYIEYLTNIEKNKVDRPYATQRKQEYRIRKSKYFIDKIDDLIGPLYNLTSEEVNFIKNYEIEFRIRSEKE